MGDYMREHLKFPLITCGFTAVAVFIFRDWSPHKTTLILSTICIAISVGLMLVKYSSFRMHRSREDALIFNICLAQIVAGVVAIIAVFLTGAIEPRLVYMEARFAKLIYLFVLSVGLIITGNMGIFGGGSLFVIMLSSAALYWIPVLKTLVHKVG
jgi:hypothetical protein